MNKDTSSTVMSGRAGGTEYQWNRGQVDIDTRSTCAIRGSGVRVIESPRVSEQVVIMVFHHVPRYLTRRLAKSTVLVLVRGSDGELDND